MFKKIQNNSPVVIGFVVICFISLILNYITKGFTNEAFFMIYRTSLIDPLFYLRLFTHVFGHQNFEHFFGNMIIILLLGPILEEKYSSRILIGLIAITALITGLLNVIISPNALLGASGVVFMFMILASYVNLQKDKIPLTLILVVTIFIGQEIIAGFVSHDNISRITHIAGGLCGGILGYYINKKSDRI